MNPTIQAARAGRTRGTLQRTGLAAVGGAVMLVLGCVTVDPPLTCTGAADRNPNNCLGFRSGAPPTSDGVIAGDEVRSFRYVLGDGNGSTVPDAVVQGMRRADALYLSFEVNNDPTFDLDDAIVLAFDPTGDPTNHRRIHIYPVFPAGASAAGTPQAVEYWKNSTLGDPDWRDPDLAVVDPTPAWLLDNIRVTSANSGSSKHWRVEVRIPVVADEHGPGINLPDDDDFGFYFSVLVVESDAGVTEPVVEQSWPLGQHVGDFIEDTPPASAWGIFGHLANGVTITSLDIGTNQDPTQRIDLDEPNIFYANVHNNMTDAAGNPVVANNVRASFHLRNFGIPGASPWDLIPAGNNPTRLQSVPAAGVAQFQSDSWTVPAARRPHYAANPSQCLLVALETTEPGTLIISRSVMRNMGFVETSSPFRESAVVGTRGYRVPKGERELEFLLREFRYNTRATARWRTELAGAARVSEGLYRLRARPGPDVRLDKVITPPFIEIPVERVHVPPGRPGQARRIPVRPGHIVTIVAAGSITRGDVRIGPNGTQVGRPEVDLRFPLPASFAPEGRVGALIGSFDGFDEEAFVVGSAATVMVPQGAGTLELAINDSDDGWQLQQGDGFRVEVIRTPPDEVFGFTTSLLPRRPPRTHTVLPLGQNLPTWILCGQVRTGEVVRIRGRTYQRFEKAGCYGYMVKRIGSAGGPDGGLIRPDRPAGRPDPRTLPSAPPSAPRPPPA